MSELKRTSLYEKHKELGAKNIGFCGWDMPVQYEGILKEHKACREEAAIFDTSHMGEFFFEGNILFSGINEAVTVDLLTLPVGRCKYGFILNDKGGVIDDMIVYKADIDRLMFVVNASRIQEDFDAIKAQVHNGAFTNASDSTSKIDIQGPKSKEILEHLLHVRLDGLNYFSFTEADIMDTYGLISRTGYTGELGYELYLDNTAAPKVWDKLIKLGATPAGLGARDVLRLEMGYSLYGQELDENTTPLEAGLEYFVQYTSHFRGKEALEQQKQNGIPKKLIAFKTNSKRAPRHGFEIMQEGLNIGVVTSGTYSPSVASGIGLGYVETSKFNADKPIQISSERGSMPVELTTLPFYKK
ncbi:MAG TPA: glycine cleavage system protein T [Sulfurospirillum sp. UBA12182]|jgi:aminomethyltransferase|nr:MAG TPA: glycine cleavage system protein T [Sulfurospirillum sp. UBA12182]